MAIYSTGDPRANIPGRMYIRRELELDMPIDELAAQLSEKVGTVSLWEQGLKVIPMKAVPKIAKILGTTTDYLYGTTDEATDEKRKKERLVYRHIVQRMTELDMSMEELSRALDTYLWDERDDDCMDHPLEGNRLERFARSLQTTEAYLLREDDDDITGRDTPSGAVRRLRVESGLQRKDLAEELGVLQPTIRGYETGYIPRARIAELADFFGVPIKEIDPSLAFLDDLE